MGQSSYPDVIRPLLEAKCFDCHADGASKGGVTFDGFASDAGLMADTKLWHRVLKNVRDGLMPPPEKDQPTSGERQLLQQWIKTDVFRLDPTQPDPGRPVLRRLNRTEYRNSIRDLTGYDFPVNEEFPADDTGHGFDNIGAVLTVSPMLLEKYLTAARSIVQQVVPQVARIMPEQRVGPDRFFRMENKDGVVAKGGQSDNLSYYTPMTLAATMEAKESGHYAISFELSGHDKYVEGVSDLNRCRLHFCVDGEELGTHDFGNEESRHFTFPYRHRMDAGRHELSVELERLTPNEKPVRSLLLKLDRVKISGPEAPGLWERPVNYTKWFPRDVPEDPAARLAYAEELLGKFASRAFRRPLTDDTASRLAGLAAKVAALPGQCFESGVSRAMEAVLASPRFLFMEEFTLPPDPAHRHPLVDEFSLASRLSYFLWSTLPDAELLRLAEAGQLRKNLLTQFQRMLADEKSRDFFRNFPGQWLQARDIEQVTIDARSVLQREQAPDPEAMEARRVFMELRKIEATQLTAEEKLRMDQARAVFRRTNDRFKDVDFRGELRRDMRRETEQYFEYVIRQDRPLTELIDSNYTFLNKRLALHYGVEGVEGDEIRKVTLPADSLRGGILTQGSVLAVTSNPTRTSPVKRGLFILENILGSPPPPPPPDIPALEDNNGRGQPVVATLRDILLKHRADAKCASCHNRMDPLGLAFENFNAMGHWRGTERGVNVDAGGQLITGEKFTGARELKKILVSNHREAFHRCFIEKLLIYALGRGMDYQDETTIDLLMEKLDKTGGRPTSLLEGIIESDVFQRRRMPESPGAEK